MRKARFTVMRARAFVDAIVRALDERLIGWQDLIQVGREGDWFPV
jgi:DNA-directed RNA polymerase specialized sigma subunit